MSDESTPIRPATAAVGSALDRPVVKPRPVYLDLVRIRLPIPGIVSILHRVSGAVLFLFGIPLLLFVVGRSLGSPETFADILAVFRHPLAKLLTIGFLWAYLHHFFAGIRYLFIDLAIGDDLAPARKSSVIVMVVSIALTLIIGVRLW